MSTQVSHDGYEIISWPKNAVSPDVLYLQVGDQVIAAARFIASGWRIVLFQDGIQEAFVGANVGDQCAALGWLRALGQLASAASVAA